MSNSETQNQPVQEIRMGLIRAVVWANPTKSNGIKHNVTLSRIYRDTNGDWQETESLGRNDLRLTGEVLDAAILSSVAKNRSAKPQPTRRWLRRIEVLTPSITWVSWRRKARMSLADAFQPASVTHILIGHMLNSTIITLPYPPAARNPVGRRSPDRAKRVGDGR